MGKNNPGQITNYLWIDMCARFSIRGQKIMPSLHLAELYEVEPRALVQAIKRNIERFPEDFMFQLNPEEFANLKSQILISSWGGIRAAPYAFTEQGALMLGNVLKSVRVKSGMGLNIFEVANNANLAPYKFASPFRRRRKSGCFLPNECLLPLR